MIHYAKLLLESHYLLFFPSKERGISYQHWNCSVSELYAASGCPSSYEATEAIGTHCRGNYGNGHISHLIVAVRECRKLVRCDQTLRMQSYFYNGNILRILFLGWQAFAIHSSARS